MTAARIVLTQAGGFGTGTRSALHADDDSPYLERLELEVESVVRD